MIKISVAVCDDNENSLQAVSGALAGVFKQCGIETEVDLFSSADALIRKAATKNYSIVFLDIDMPGTDGIECGRRLRSQGSETEIVYVSAREDRVFESFSVRPIAFVRKTHFLSDAAEAVRGYSAMLAPKGSDGSISLSTHGGMINAKLSDIIYFEGSGVYQQMKLRNSEKPVEVISRMEKLEAELEPHGFIRVHKGYLVNYAHITRLDSTEVTMDSGEKLPVSRRKTADIKKHRIRWNCVMPMEIA